RTAVMWEGLPEPVQVVQRRVALRLEAAACDPLAGDVAAQLKHRYGPGRHRIDVREAPLVRCMSAHDEGDGRGLLPLLAHPLAIDPSSLAFLVEEVERIESGREVNAPAPAPFRSFVARARLGLRREEHVAFFREMLADVGEPTAPFGRLERRG